MHRTGHLHRVGLGLLPGVHPEGHLLGAVGVGQGDEFRSTVHRGGSVEPVTLAPAYEETAVRAAQIMGLRVAGVAELLVHAGHELVGRTLADSGLSAG